MQLHGPKRVYTQDSLEFWFGKLESDWDGFFTTPHLEAGREMYRTGGIREVELSATDAVVHSRIEKKDEYSVLEWTGDQLVVRSSCADELLGKSIAVAGLHEIEELIADELSLLPVDLPDDGMQQNGNSSANGNGGQALGSTVRGAIAARNSTSGNRARTDGIANGDGARSGGAVRQGAPSGRSRGAGPKRELLLKFSVIPKGLVCEPWWLATGSAPVPALPAASKSNGNGHANGNGSGNGHGNGNTYTASPMERMKVISLTALAKKSHFHFQSELGAYLLEQVSEISHFLTVVLPTWARSFKIEAAPEVERLRSGVQSVKIEAKARRVRGNAIDLEWILRTGEQLIDEAHVAELHAAQGAPVIIPEVGLVALPLDDLESVERWEESTQEFAPGELPAYLLFSLFSDQRFRLDLSPELETWRKDVLAPKPMALSLPEFLRPYQRRGVEWLAHLCELGCHGLLADEMGLGKTVQVASLFAARPVDGKPHLVVCPASVVPVWQEEIRRFFPGTSVFVLKNGHDFRDETSQGIWLASYAQLRNHRSLLEDFEFGYAVLDEGQFIKNPDAKVTNTCFEIRSKHRIVLTGTPLENRQLDLWSILHFLLPGLLGTRGDFEALLQRDRDATMEKLRAQLAPFILRRTKAEVARELPPKVEIDLLCPLSDLQRQQYGRVCREGLERLGDDISQAMREKSFGFLSLLTRLRQICCDPDLLPWLVADTAESGKLALLVERLREVISNGHKVVIFSQFVMFLKRVHEVLEQHFPDLARFELTGSTVDRQKPVQDFQNIDQPAVMLVSLKAAGTGITLHAADYVFLLDPWWNPSVEDQAVDRVHRIGQTRTVLVYRLITQGTIEERIQALKAEKKQLFRQLIEGVSGDLDLGSHFQSMRQLIELSAEQAQADADASPLD